MKPLELPLLILDYHTYPYICGETIIFSPHPNCVIEYVAPYHPPLYQYNKHPDIQTVIYQIHFELNLHPIFLPQFKRFYVL